MSEAVCKNEKNYDNFMGSEGLILKLANLKISKMKTKETKFNQIIKTLDIDSQSKPGYKYLMENEDLIISKVFHKS